MYLVVYLGYNDVSFPPSQITAKKLSLYPESYTEGTGITNLIEWVQVKKLRKNRVYRLVDIKIIYLRISSAQNPDPTLSPKIAIFDINQSAMVDFRK